MSYFSNILTATKTRYNTLRQNDDADGNTEDDSHLTRALRNYYLETPHRPYPDWLPPPPSQRSQSPALAPIASLRNTYGRRQSPAAQQPGTSLSDIWDAPPAEQPGRPTFSRNVSSGSSRPQLFPDEAGPSGGNMTAQQRIKERLWGSRGATASPPPQQHAPPPPQQGGRLEMPSRVNSGGRAGQQPYMGAGMPWDDGMGAEYEAPGVGYGAGNMRRGQRPGLPNGPKDGRAPPYR